MMEITVLNERLEYSSQTKMIGAENGGYGYDVFLICSRTIYQVLVSQLLEIGWPISQVQVGERSRLEKI
jgi:hypothetical protein